ncbi:hypothetical protein BDV12DRAFT_188135 [Aspergillus spectabilis]
MAEPSEGMNNFKPWAPPHRKPFSPHKSLNPCSPRPKNPLPSTLPLPKYHLPARPPAEVCVHISANTQPCTALSSQLQPREISVPQPNTYSENPRRSAMSPHDSASHISDLDPIAPCDFQDNTGILIELPAFRGDFAEDEEFFRLPDTQDDIPVDLVILANHGPWEDSDLQQSIPQANSTIISETTCPYPDPPPVHHNSPGYYRDSSERASSQNSNAQTSDHPHIHDWQAHKWLRVPSTLPSREDSFTDFCSHIVSLPLDERLQFLSWLFEGALPRCMSDSSPIAWGLLRKLRMDEGQPWSQVAKLFSEQYPGRSQAVIQVYWSMTLNKREQ